MRNITEWSNEYNIELFTAFVDYEKSLTGIFATLRGLKTMVIATTIF